MRYYLEPLIARDCSFKLWREGLGVCQNLATLVYRDHAGKDSWSIVDRLENAEAHSMEQVTKCLLLPITAAKAESLLGKRGFQPKEVADCLKGRLDMPKLPDLEMLSTYVEGELILNPDLRGKMDLGCMDRREYLISRYISWYCDLHTSDEGDEGCESWLNEWCSHFSEACEAAGIEFGIPAIEARGLFQKFLRLTRKPNPK